MIKLCQVLLLSLVSLIITGQKLTYEQTEGGILISEGKDKILHFQTETKSLDGAYPRANYIHPLYGIDGAELTEDFPLDHLHHRGVFWAWHQVLIGDGRIADSWECRNIEWDVTFIKADDNENGSLSLYLTTEWLTDAINDPTNKSAILSENIKITAFPKIDNYRIVDVDITLKALVSDLRIGGSEDEKGYGGFSVRMKMPEDVKFTSSGKEIQPETGQVEAGLSMNISGSLTNNHKQAGIVIINHPNNPMRPNRWILRESGSMQNAAFPGREAIPISEKDPTVLKYRLIIYQGQFDETSFSRDYSH